jgi:type IV pilus assembly protein PilQ
MRENIQKILVAFLICFLVFFGAFRPAESASPSGPPDAGITNTSGTQQEVGYLEDIAFEKIQGKERIKLTVSRQPAIDIEDQDGAVVLLKLENIFVPEELRQPLGRGKLPNIIIVSPTQRTFQGKQWAYLTIALREQVPYTIIQEAQKVFIDFNVTSPAGAVPTGAEKPVTVEKKDDTPPPGDQKIQQTYSPEKAAPPGQEEKFYRDTGRTPAVYTGHKISLDFQDANIRSVFRLLAELSGTSIVPAPDVKGNITINMKNVPWDQALDTIMAIQGLGKMQTGNVITVMSLEKMRKEDADRKSLEEAQKKTEEELAKTEQKRLAEKGKLRQISIEAKIVEVTTSFSRELGVQWGYGYQDVWRGRDYGVLVGTGGSTITTLPGVGGTGGIGLTTSNVAVNFPSSTLAAAPAVGVILGSSKFILDAKLEALESTGEGKIVSSPKVTTLDNVEATIWQGREIPVVTPATANNPSTTTYKDADLRLIVTPKITPEGDRISMKIDASDKDIDRTTERVLGNPVIKTSGVKSNIVVKEGDTIVVGGIYKETELNRVSGVPGLSKIPILGWLFKSQTKEKEKREILIFITPRIIK